MSKDLDWVMENLGKDDWHDHLMEWDRQELLEVLEELAWMRKELES